MQLHHRLTPPMMAGAVLACLFIAFSARGRSAWSSDPAKAPATPAISFHRDVVPILARNCFGCHQGSKQQGHYNMVDFATFLAGGDSGEPAIVPGVPDESHLVAQITSVDGVAEMPVAPAKPLAESEVETIRNWILQGAKDDSPVDRVAHDAEHPPVYAAAPSMPAIAASPTDDLIAVAGHHEVLLLDASASDDDAVRNRLIGISPRINSLAFSPDGMRLAVAGGTPCVSGELQVWDVASGQLQLSIARSYDTLTGVSWAPDGKLIAVAASDNTFVALDSQTGERKLFQGAHEDWVRGTIFTPDSKHIVSVARDMTCKLTEVDTQRFVDNVTSITPGALSGGLSSVAMHPTRNEILVGGADGIAKVYRVFRETTRRIGDDANLVRSLPKMKGRIFSVAISNGGSHLAAVSSIDGKSELRIWAYDFDGTLSEEHKTILAKRVSERSAAEIKTIKEHRNQSTTETARLEFDAAAYAIDFTRDGRVVVAANDGAIRRVSVDGKVETELRPFSIDAGQVASMRQFDLNSWSLESSSAESDARDHSAAPTVPSPSTESDPIVSLTIEPSVIEFTSPYQYTQIVATGVTRSEESVDLTRMVTSTSPSFVDFGSNGLVRPLHDGDATVTFSFQGIQTEVPISANGIDPAPHTDPGTFGAVDFVQDVNPVLTRLGCNQGTCHGAQKGKAGFKLSLRGYDPIYDLRALTDDLAARRIDPSAPDASLMLQKPLGLAPHQGGVLMNAGDRYHTILRRWIADGCELNLGVPKVESISVTPQNPVVQTIGHRQQVRVVATFEDGTRRDVTREAFIESGNTEVATAQAGGMLVSVRRGEAPILARYEGAYAATTLTVMGDRSGYRPPNRVAWNPVDELVADKWHRMKVVPSELCDDATFLRRIHLDLTGLPPSSDAVRAFLDDASPQKEKRSRVIDELIGNDDYVVYWTNKWADLLQVNRKYLGINGAAAFRKWIEDSVAKEKPYDQFAHEILTASGSNKSNPPAAYYKTLREPEALVENTTHLFLGIRFNCNKCHDHPFERWTQDQYYETAAFFSRVRLEKDPESGGKTIAGSAVDSAKPLYENVIDGDSGDVKHPRNSQVVAPKFPFESQFEVGPEATRREQLAAWVTSPDNPYFARSYVNRIWAAMTGVGLIEPVDDIRAGNPASNPELLDYLTQEFIHSRFDVRHIQRLIANSRTYQLSVKTQPMNQDDTLNYSHAKARRLPAEVIFDAVHQVTGSVSEIPGMPAGTRAAAMTDSGVKLKDGFLQNLGRPARESACECERSTGLQLGPVMALVSGPTIGSAIADPKNDLASLVDQISDDGELVDEIFLRCLGRHAQANEYEAFDSIMPLVDQDHIALQERLQAAEADWKVRFEELEAERKSQLALTQNQQKERQAEIVDEQASLAQAREQRIEKAEQKLAEIREKLPKKVAQFVTKKRVQRDQSAEWHPLRPISTSATNKDVLVAQPDRSIVSRGKHEKGVYVVTLKTGLTKITGVRLEALADPALPADGPGAASNGNFVVTEFVAKNVHPETNKAKPLPIKKASADFSQPGLSPQQAIDGRTRDQRGWAVAGSSGVDHWAIFELTKPLVEPTGATLRIEISQFHKSPLHRLGRFRISVTSDDGPIPLGLSESLASDVSIPKADRDEAATERLTEYVASTDKELSAARGELAAARKPVPRDAKLVALETREKRLSIPTPTDPRLLQLRQDADYSAEQIKNIRLTAAEDLVWALVNSPAFLFNH